MTACSPRIVIAYCTQCHWLLRAAWMAQELLSTFGADLGGVALAPRTGGVFEITCDRSGSARLMAAFPTSRSLSNACAIASIPAATSATLTTRRCRIRPHPRTRHDRPSPSPALSDRAAAHPA